MSTGFVVVQAFQPARAAPKGCITNVPSLQSVRPKKEEHAKQMTTEAITRLHQARPFRRFVLRLGDGQALPVDHPEMLAYAPNSRTATVYRRDGSFEIVDLLLVTGLDVPNGKRPKVRCRT
jgi:hypothetical protein